VADATEGVRRALCTVINSVEAARAELVEQHGQVWDTDELGRDFEVKGFMAPFVSVVRKSDGKPGVMLFQHAPRFYFDFQTEE